MKTVLFSLAFFVSILSIAQISQINGKIINKESKEVLPGTNILIEGTMNAYSSNQNGEFSIKTKQNFPITLIISYIGYKTERIELNSQPEKNILIELGHTKIITDEIIIKGVRQSEGTPLTYTNISHQSIDKINTGQDIPLLLEMTPSVTSTSDAGIGIGYTGLRIRGTDQNRINVSINGVPYNDPESHGVYWVDIPDLASSSHSIQIQRGVGTSSNGAASFGGSINIQTLSLKTNPYATIYSRFGSYKSYGSTLLFGTGLINGKWVLDGRTSFLHSDGYIDRAFTNLKSLYLNAAYYGEKTMIRAMIMNGIEDTYQAWYGVPKDSLITNRRYNPYNYENEIDHYKQDHYHLIMSNQHNRNWSSSATLFLIKGNGFYEQFKEEDSYSNYLLANVIIGTDTISETDLIRRKWMDNSFYGGVFNINYDNFKKIDFCVGGGINLYQGDHFGKIIWMENAGTTNINHEYYRNNGTKSDQNIYIKSSYKIKDKTTISIDLQGRYISQTVEGDEDDKRALDIKQSYMFFNPKLGIFHSSGKHSIYAYSGIANREPNRYMLVDADSGLCPSPERLYDYEAGYRFQTENLNSNINFYYMRYQNQLVLTGEINNVGAPIYVNVAKSYRAGAEFIWSWQIRSKLKWSNTCTFSINKIKNFTAYIDNWDNGIQETEYYSESNISFSPAIIESNSLEFQIFKNASITVNSKYVSRQYIDNTSSKERSLDPYFTNNLYLQYSLKTKLAKELTFRLSLMNILSEKYENNAWIYRYYYGGEHYVIDGYFPQAPMHFFASVKIDF